MRYAQQAGAYPDHPVTLVVPFSAGGDADVAARSLAVVAQKVIGQPLVPVQPRRRERRDRLARGAQRQARRLHAAARARRLAGRAAGAAADAGYRWNDFTFLGLLELQPVSASTRADSPIRSLKDLVEALRARPGKLNYSTSGAGHDPQLRPAAAVRRPQARARKPPCRSPTRAAARPRSRCCRGDVDFSCGNLTSLIGNIKGGKLRALVTTTPER